VDGESARLLVVDDDAGLRSLLTQYLSKEGFQVVAVPDGAAMDAWLAREEADLVILDLMLPGEDGLSLARRIRARSQVPIVMLSARGEDVDRIVGLEVGADDYLAKPFNPRELLARIRAVLRRHAKACPDEGAAEEGRVFTFGPFRLETAAQRLTREGEPVELTTGEYALLRILVERPNRVLSRDTLVDLLKGYERDPFDRSVDVRVARLRAKIEEDSKEPRYIRTVWGQGYLFAPDGEKR
jgi:two-component system phosphate regulon response regulator OmpR